MEYIVGDEIEVKGDDGMFKFAYYGARVTAVHDEGLEIVYHNRRTLSGELLMDIVAENQVRRVPDAVIGDFKQKDSVEAWMWGGWWQGLVLGGDNDTAIVYFRYREIDDQHHIIPKGQLRIHQRWCDDGDYIRWLYKKRIMDEFFKAGDEVEVAGVNGVYKYALFGARVLNMQGEIVEVEYSTQANPAGGRLIEKVNVSQVRYVPDLVAGEIGFGDYVEAWVDGAWWGGIALGGTNEAAIMYFGYKPVGQHEIVPREHLRIHQKWYRAGMYGASVYRKKKR